jgi:hypothetical protein
VRLADGRGAITNESVLLKTDERRCVVSETVSGDTLMRRDVDRERPRALFTPFD